LLMMHLQNKQKSFLEILKLVFKHSIEERLLKEKRRECE